MDHSLNEIKEFKEYTLKDTIKEYAYKIKTPHIPKRKVEFLTNGVWSEIEMKYLSVGDTFRFVDDPLTMWVAESEATPTSLDVNLLKTASLEEIMEGRFTWGVICTPVTQ